MSIKLSKTPIYDFVAGPIEHSRHASERIDDPGSRFALSRDAEIRGFTPDAFTFWRNILVLFCMFSVAGHWLEIGYCSIMELLFDVVADDYSVWDDPMYPYLVYGIATIVCTLVLMPLKIRLLYKRKTLAGACAELFVITVFLCMFMELAMGLLLNQPDAVTGEYPLWDNSQLPLNILGQAWLVNDIFLGFAAGLYIWVVYPFFLWLFSHIPPTAMNVLSVIIVIGFIVLCVIKLS